MAAAPCVYDQPVNTSTDHGETSRTDSAKSLTSFITADVPPCLRQAEFQGQICAARRVELRSPRVRICDDGSQVVDVRHLGAFLR